MMRLRVPRKAFAASAAALALSYDSSKEKPPIYTTHEPPIIIIDEPSELEKRIGSVRRKVTGAYSDTHSRVQGVVSRWIGVEHAVERRVKSLMDPSEEITPGLLYTTIATLSTSIITRSRSLPVRFILPPTAFLVSLSYFLPKTSSNVSDYVTELEERYTPSLAQKHATARAHSGMLVDRIEDGWAQWREQLGTGVGLGVDWLQGVTGLKIREAIGWSEDVIQGTEARTKAVTREVGKMLERDKQNVEGFAKEVADGIKGRTEASTEKLEEMVETDKGLLGQAKAWVGDVAKETEARTKVAADELGKMIQTDKELIGKTAEETKETAEKKTEAKKLV